MRLNHNVTVLKLVLTIFSSHAGGCCVFLRYNWWYFIADDDIVSADHWTGSRGWLELKLLRLKVLQHLLLILLLLLQLLRLAPPRLTGLHSTRLAPHRGWPGVTPPLVRSRGPVCQADRLPRPQARHPAPLRAAAPGRGEPLRPTLLHVTFSRRPRFSPPEMEVPQVLDSSG